MQNISKKAVKMEVVEVKEETVNDMEPKEVLPDRQLESHEQELSQSHAEVLETLDNQEVPDSVPPDNVDGSGHVPTQNEISVSGSVDDAEKKI